MFKKTKQSKHGKGVLLSITFFVLFVLILAYLLREADVALLQPRGKIAGEQFRLLMTLAVLLLAVAIPTLLVLYTTVWKNRTSNTRPSPETQAKYGKFFVVILWGFPISIALSVSLLLWPATHKLEPKKPISSANSPITIQVVAMRWKWLFIYPEQGIATVNYIQIPVDTPIQFDLTADETPMSSFWIPHLGGQLYAMTGHLNRLNLMSDSVGDFTGSSAEINGAGFSGMRFTARTSSSKDYEQWLSIVKNFSKDLDVSEYNKLLEPSVNVQREYYSNVDSSLFATIMTKYAGSHEHKSMEHE